MNACIVYISSRDRCIGHSIKSLWDNFNYKHDYPVYVHYFDDIYDSAEALYTSRVNYETTPKLISFVNYDYTNLQKEKVTKLYYDHDIRFDEFDKDVDLFVLKILIQVQ